MNSVFTTRLATLFLAVACTATASMAQAPRRTTPVKRTTTAAKTARPVQTPKATATVAAAPAPQAQPAAAPAPMRNQPVAAEQTTSARPTSAYSTRSRSYRSSGSGVAHTKYLNLGVGLATYYGGGVPLGASFEVGVKNNFSVGGSIDYLHYGYSDYYYSSGYNYVFFGARASYHLGEALGVQDNKFDPYIGATLGFRYTGNSYSDYYYSSGYNNGAYIGIHLGARYMLGDHVGLFSEVGYGVSVLKGGLTVKF